MATIILPNFNSQKTVEGLNTYQYTIQTTGPHVAKIRVAIQQASALSIVISQSGSQNVTLASISANPIVAPADDSQSSLSLIGVGNFVAGDVVSFTLTSAAVVDQAPNMVKASITLTLGTGN